MRQAYLIIAHNNFKALQHLIDSLDCEGTDFYVHIDRKVKTVPELKVTKGCLCVLRNRIDVRWGDVSQIEVELLLMEEAFKTGGYDFYHIISGTHIALKPVTEINSFFESRIGQNLSRVWEKNEGDADFKMRRIHLCVKSLKYGSSVERCIANFVWRSALAIQKCSWIRIRRRKKFFKTDNWCSLSESGVRTLLEKKGQILKEYKYSFCPDEYFVATELYPNITDCKCMLFAHFIGTGPRGLNKNDIVELRKSAYLFARKVDDGLFFIENTKLSE